MSLSACFISDAHLGLRNPGWEAREERLVRFLRTLDPSITHLVVVGDLFDFWIEYRHLIRSEYFPVLRALADLHERGVELHYVAGNHDFALGSFLTDRIGMKIHPVALSGELLGTRVHVQHGDGLLPCDWDYRLLRYVLRNRINQRLFRMIHPTLGIGLASCASRLSRHGSSGRPLKQKRIEQYRTAAKNLLLKNRAEIVVLGHTHSPEICRGPEGTYCNSGEWIKRATYALLHEGRISLWELTANGPAAVQETAW